MQQDIAQATLVLEQQAATDALPAVQHTAVTPMAPPPTESPVAMALAALERGLTPEQVSKMMDLHDRWRADEARNAFNEAMTGFAAECVTVKKLKNVNFVSQKGVVDYNHARLSDVRKAVGPALARYGLSYAWTTKQAKDWVEVTCTLRHRLGHAESVTLGGPPDSSGSKNPLQAIHSAVSYLERYTLKAVTGVAEEDDDDDGRGGPDAPDAPEAEPDALLQAAREAALGGWKALGAWIKQRTEDEVRALEPHSSDLKAAAIAADKRGKEGA